MPELAAPEGWVEIEPEWYIQKRVFQRRRDGLVVSIEKGTGHRFRWSAVTLPENFYEDSQVIDVIEDADSQLAVEAAAVDYMKENPR